MVAADADGWDIEQVGEFVEGLFPQYKQTFVGNYINGWRLLNQVTSSAQLSSMGIMDYDHQKSILGAIKQLRAAIEEDLFNAGQSMIDYDDPAASLGLEGSAEEEAAAAKMQAIQRGRAGRARASEMKGKRIEEELGLEGTEEEAARIAKMQAAHRGKKDRRRVAEMKGKKIEVRCSVCSPIGFRAGLIRCSVRSGGARAGGHRGGGRADRADAGRPPRQEGPPAGGRDEGQEDRGGARAGGYGGGGGADRQDAGGAQREEGPPEGRRDEGQEDRGPQPDPARPARRCLGTSFRLELICFCWVVSRRSSGWRARRRKRRRLRRCRPPTAASRTARRSRN